MSREDFLSMVHKLLPQSQWQDLENALSIGLSKSISLCGSRMSQDIFFSIAQETARKITHTSFPVLDDVCYVTQDDTQDRIQAIGSHVLHQFGFCYIQEVAASIPAHFIDIPSNGVVLDMSAAPGGKSIQIADKALREGKNITVWSNDVDAKRLPALVSNINRTGSYNTVVSKIDGIRIGELFPEMFDSILLDAPCSGEGTAFKSDDALKWRRQENIVQIAGLQKQLLQSAMQALKVGGSIVYSTCTLNTLENEENIARLMETYGDAIVFEPLDFPGGEKGISSIDDKNILPKNISDGLIRCWPHLQKTGGFFVAKIRKIKSIGKISSKKNNSFKKIEHLDVTKDIATWLDELFGMQIDTSVYRFVQKHDLVYVIPSHMKSLLDIYPRYHVGIPVAKGKKSDYRPLHGLGTVLGCSATTRVYIMDDEQALQYTQGKDLSVEDTYVDGRYILYRRDCPVSIGKVVNGMMKNKFL